MGKLPSLTGFRPQDDDATFSIYYSTPPPVYCYCPLFSIVSNVRPACVVLTAAEWCIISSSVGQRTDLIHHLIFFFPRTFVDILALVISPSQNIEKCVSLTLESFVCDKRRRETTNQKSLAADCDWRDSLWFDNPAWLPSCPSLATAGSVKHTERMTSGAQRHPTKKGKKKKMQLTTDGIHAKGATHSSKVH